MTQYVRSEQDMEKFKVARAQYIKSIPNIKVDLSPKHLKAYAPPRKDLEALQLTLIKRIDLLEIK